MIPLALCFCGFVVLTNLSLENNSVGTYQVAKVMTTPCVLLIQYYYYGKSVNTATLLTVVSYYQNQ
jgi:solute carrier family 35 protein E3